MSMRHVLLPPSRTSRTRPRLATVICGLVSISTAVTLSGCGSSTETAPTDKTTPSTTTTTTSSQLTVQDAWAKTADGGMTAVFGQLRNTGGSPVTVSSATTSASPRTELHETVMVGGTMQMQPKKGGFVIPAGATFPLAPGGNHIMVMDLKTPIRPGDKVNVKLTLADGSTVAFSALGKASSGGKETYAPSPSTMPGMDMPSTSAAK